MDQRASAPLADDEVAFDVGLLEHLEQAHAVDAARSAGDADNQPAASHIAVNLISRRHDLIMHQSQRLLRNQQALGEGPFVIDPLCLAREAGCLGGAKYLNG